MSYLVSAYMSLVLTYIGALLKIPLYILITHILYKMQITSLDLDLSVVYTRTLYEIHIVHSVYSSV